MNPMEPANEPVMNEGPENEIEKPETPAMETDEHAPVDIDAIRSKMNIDPQLQDMYEKCIVNGRRIMFNSDSFKQTSKYLEGEGPMAQKIADGVVAVFLLIWKESNQTLNPKLVVPVTLGLTLDAFEFLQKSNNPEATKEVLGEAVEMATSKIMDKFGVPPDQVAQLVEQNRAAVEGGQSEQPGILGGA